MKKTVSLFLIFAIVLSFCTPVMPVFAADAANSLLLGLDAGSGDFIKTQYRTISYTITNQGNPVGIKYSLYIDDVVVLPEGVMYSMLYGQKNGSINVCIPSSLSTSKNHSLILKVSCSDGSFAEKRLDISLKSKPAATLSFLSYPPTLDIGADIPLAVKIAMPDKNSTYRLGTTVELNGVKYPELGRVQNIAGSDTLFFNIPGSYNKKDLVDFKLKISANSQSGEPTGSVSLTIPMTGPAAKAAKDVENLVKPVIITAYVHKNTSAYAYASLTGYRASIPAGSYVTYLNPDSHDSMKAARVKTQSGSIYWVPMSNIYISKENYVIADTLTKEQKEQFVNGRGYSSKTSYLIWVNLQRQILCVFMGSKGNWKLINKFPVATGKNTTPTPTVEHEIEYVTKWVTPEYTCSPVLYLYNGYAIHNQPVAPSGYITDKTIGKPASAGCVRMLQKDVNWVRSYCPVKTNVVIY
ncbi:MAG: L,D-transpeptidase [Clostridia bacterium]|nr:L,D-transpeptidase [Clostridia bacterium]